MEKEPTVWHALAEKIENECATFNQDRIDTGRRPLPFPVDVVRRMLIVLRDAKRPVPAFAIEQHEGERHLTLRWSRLNGEAFVRASRDDVVHVSAVVAGRVLAKADDVAYVDFDPRPLLEALDHFTPLKQVIVVRRDLGMRQGKACSQSSHSSGEFMREQIVASLKDGRPLDFSDDEIEWMTEGMAKITVRSDSVEQFDGVAEDAISKGLKVRVITDSGRTEFGGVPTVTALAIGPTRSAYVDGITGGLTLL